jgi:hypothetical protein
MLGTSLSTAQQLQLLDKRWKHKTAHHKAETKFNVYLWISGIAINMQLIVVSVLIAILASVSANWDVGKTANDFDFNKISTVMAVCWDCVFQSHQDYGCVTPLMFVFFQVDVYVYCWLIAQSSHTKCIVSSKCDSEAL